MSETAIIDAPWTCPPRIVCQECGAESEHPFGCSLDEAPNEGDPFTCECGATLELSAYDCDDDRGSVWQWETSARRAALAVELRTARDETITKCIAELRADVERIEHERAQAVHDAAVHWAEVERLRTARDENASATASLMDGERAAIARADDRERARSALDAMLCKKLADEIALKRDLATARELLREAVESRMSAALDDDWRARVAAALGKDGAR